MKVKQLIEILKTVNGELPIAVHANNHTYESGVWNDEDKSTKISLMKHYAGDHILIGNQPHELEKPCGNHHVESHIYTPWND